MVKAFDCGHVPHESAGRDIHAHARLAAALRAVKRGDYFSRRVAPVYFANQMNVRAEGIPERRAVKRLVVL